MFIRLKKSKNKKIASFFVAFCALLLLPSMAFAAGTITVDTPLDEFGNGANCSLREAVESANTDADFDSCVRTGTAPYTIDVPAGTYELTLAGMGEDANATGDLDILASVEIAGASAPLTIIQAGAMAGAGIDRVLHVSGTVDVSIMGVTIQNGLTEMDGNGGGIANMGGATLTITDSMIANNVALGDGPGEGGGGIYNGTNGMMELSNVAVISNTAVITLGNGGGIFNDADAMLTINGGVISGNEAARAGGGVENNSGTVTFADVALDNNSTGINGGGLHISGTGVVTVTNGTASNNFAGKEGGGLWNSAAGSLTVSGAMLDGNVASGDDADQGGGGLFNDGGVMSVTNATITNNVADGAAGSGGGILNLGGEMSVTNSDVSMNSSMRAGGGIEDNGAPAATTVTLDNITLNNNSTGAAPGNGGGLHITGAGNVTMTGGEAISNTAAAEGGGLWNSAGGTLTVTGVTVSGNVASGDDADQGGGGLFNDGGVMSVTDATITNNVADGAAGSGGGILNLRGEMSVTDSDISMNSAMRAGGGIEDNGAGGDTLVNIVNTKFVDNRTGSAPGNGGALHITGEGEVTVMGGEVLGNFAAAEGGGLWNSATGSLTITNTLVSGNTASGADADQGGGGLFNDGGFMSVANATITNNVADGAAGSGGGILNLGGELIVTGGEISGNSAMRAGGGIEDNAAPAETEVTITRVLMENNTTGAAPGNGGALHITGPGDVVMVESTISFNTAAAEGGGLWNSATGSLEVIRSTIDNNSATGTAAENGGGGLYNDGGFMTVVASTVSTNDAPTDGGGIKSVGTLQLYNVTVYENSSANGAGGVANMGGTVDVVNSIIAHSTTEGVDCSGFEAGDFNLDSDGSCNAAVMADPALNALFNNGGETATHWPSDASPVFGAGDADTCLAEPVDSIDQMGFPIRSSTCSIGSLAGTAPTSLGLIGEPMQVQVQVQVSHLFLPVIR